MKDLRLSLPIILVILLVLLFAGCKGITPAPPEPGVTDDETTITGLILMPGACCVPLEDDLEENIDNAATRNSGYSGYSGPADCDLDETEFWVPIPKSIVELREFDNCIVRYKTETDDTGEYEFTDVKPGMYILTAKCPSNENYFLKSVIVKGEEALVADTPDCDSTSLAFVIEHIGDTYCHCHQTCLPCFPYRGIWTPVYDLVQKIAESKEVDMDVNKIDAIIDHKDFGHLCNDNEKDLVSMVCSILQNCCLGVGATPPGPPPTTFTLTLLVNPEGGGTTVPSVEGSPHAYPSGTVVDISATAAQGYEFVNWTGDVANANSSSTTVTMNSSKTVTANFEEIDPCADNIPPYNIDLDNRSAVVGQPYTGTVTADDDDDDTLTFAFTDGYTPPGDMAIDSVTGVITWNPTVEDICVCDETGFLRQKAEFVEVRLCAPIQVTVSDPCESVDAEFCVEVQPSYELTMQVSPVGSGTTDPAIGGPYLYTAGEVVDINAFELGGYQFLGWTSTAGTFGDPNNQNTTFTMPAQNVTVTAIFRLEEFFDGGNVTVGFEDLPSVPESDFDYNDFILDITTTLTKIIEGDEVQLKEIQFTFTPKARGAGKNSSFWFYVPDDVFELSGGNTAEYDLIIDGSAHSMGSSGNYDPASSLDLMVIPWAREALPGTHNHTNTWEFDYSETPPTTEIPFVYSGVTAQLNIVFDQPISFDFSGYDPYSDMHGQGLFYIPYLKVYSGGSSPIPGSPEYIVNEPGMGIDKRTITVPVDDGWKWPEEGIFICDAYPDVGHIGGIPDVFPLGWWLNPAEDGEDGYGGIYGDGIPKPY